MTQICSPAHSPASPMKTFTTVPQATPLVAQEHRAHNPPCWPDPPDDGGKDVSNPAQEQWDEQDTAKDAQEVHRELKAGGVFESGSGLGSSSGAAVLRGGFSESSRYFRRIRAHMPPPYPPKGS
jgi:hypothetical protein